MYKQIMLHTIKRKDSLIVIGKNIPCAKMKACKMLASNQLQGKLGCVCICVISIILIMQAYFAVAVQTFNFR